MNSDQRTLAITGPRVQQLLKKLHSLAEAEEKSLSQRFFYLKRLIRFLLFGEIWSMSAEKHMQNKFAALDEQKCQFIYLLARSMGACHVIEAGSSFGVSTIYLALAVGQNVHQKKLDSATATVAGKVIATEKEPAKAAKAREYWKEAGAEVEEWIELREGDLLETLKIEEGMPAKIDLVLLDIWTPLALPTLKLIQPKLKEGSVILTDNIGMASFLYKDLLG
ncbi:hypothetical protein E8E12_000347, partial [Didymella heteroderae]